MFYALDEIIKTAKQNGCVVKSYTAPLDLISKKRYRQTLAAMSHMLGNPHLAVLVPKHVCKKVGFTDLHTFSITHYNKVIRHIIIDDVTDYFLGIGGILRKGTSTVLVGISWDVVREGKFGIAKALLDVENHHHFVIGII